MYLTHYQRLVSQCCFIMLYSHICVCWHVTDVSSFNVTRSWHSTSSMTLTGDCVKCAEVIVYKNRRRWHWSVTVSSARRSLSTRTVVDDIDQWLCQVRGGHCLQEPSSMTLIGDCVKCAEVIVYKNCRWETSFMLQSLSSYCTASDLTRYVAVKNWHTVMKNWHTVMKNWHTVMKNWHTVLGTLCQLTRMLHEALDSSCQTVIDLIQECLHERRQLVYCQHVNYKSPSDTSLLQCSTKTLFHWKNGLTPVSTPVSTC